MHMGYDYARRALCIMHVVNVLCPLCPCREVTSLASLRNDKDVVCPQGHSLLYPLASVISRSAHWLNHLAAFSTRSSSRISLPALLAPADVSQTMDTFATRPRSNEAGYQEPHPSSRSYQYGLSAGIG